MACAATEVDDEPGREGHDASPARVGVAAHQDVPVVEIEVLVEVHQDPRATVKLVLRTHRSPEAPPPGLRRHRPSTEPGCP